MSGRPINCTIRGQSLATIGPMRLPRLALTPVAVVATVWLGGCQESPMPEPESERSAPTGVGDTLTIAQAADGTYISWREHIVDDVAVGGVPIDGSDGLTGGDLDGDGIMDVVSVHESDTTSAESYKGQYDDVADGYIRLAFGSEDPDQWTLVTLAEGREAAAPEDADIADVNGDGYPDIIVACELAHLIYFQNPGKDARTARWDRLILPVSLNRGSFIRVFFADLNGDGKPEAIAANKGGQNPGLETEQLDAISWFEVTGDPLEGDSWVEHVITRVRIPINSRPVDLDQDGDIDVLGGSRGERRIFFLENTGGETIEFNEHPIEISGTTVPDEMRTRRPRDGEPLITGFNFEFGDLNQDGRLDVVLQESSNLIWLEQPTDLSQTWTARVIGSFYPDTMTGFRFADINQDGRDDLMAGSYSQSPRDHDGVDVTRDGRLGRLAWFEQPMNPTTEWTRHDISRRKRGMFDKFLAKDMDGDGDIDFIGTRGNSVPWDGVYWLEQVRTAEPAKSFQRARDEDSVEMPLPSEPAP